MSEKKEYKYTVCNICLTYNQAIYIEDALNGFAMQNTTFPVVTLIIDDASTDGEPEVIKNYLAEHFESPYHKEETENAHIISARHKTNSNCEFVVILLKYNHQSIKKSKAEYLAGCQENAKYIALCEGDDYWIDSQKLQKQVDFMEGHPHHSICFCAHQELLSSGEKKVINRYSNDVEECPMDDIILGGGGYMATNSMLYRRSLFVPYRTWAIGCPIGDLPLMLTLAHKGKVGYLADTLCTYRVAAIGSWNRSMSSSWKKRWRHYKAIKKMWRQYDEWTDRIYHEVIEIKVRNNSLSYIKGEISRLIKQ